MTSSTGSPESDTRTVSPTPPVRRRVRATTERAAPLKPLPPAKRDVVRMQGYLRPDDFLAYFRYVREKAYESKSLREYLKSLRL